MVDSILVKGQASLCSCVCQPTCTDLLAPQQTAHIGVSGEAANAMCLSKMLAIGQLLLTTHELSKQPHDQVQLIMALLCKPTQEQ